MILQSYYSVVFRNVKCQISKFTQWVALMMRLKQSEGTESKTNVGQKNQNYLRY